TDPERNVSSADVNLCDNGFTGGWYSFQGAAGTHMPLSPPAQNTCGTDAPGWLNGTEPSTTQGIVSRQVCFNYAGNDCTWSSNIHVVNCGNQLVYQLPPPPTC